MAVNINALSSLWDGLSEHLIASFYEVERDTAAEDAQNTDGGMRPQIWRKKSDSKTVLAPLTDIEISADLKWESSFDCTNPENKAPTALAALQAGLLTDVVQAVMPNGGVSDTLQKGLGAFQGRTGVTKLNSTQVFLGLMPLKISCTAHFRAWRSAFEEVEKPINQLMQWALPEELSKDGSLVARLGDNKSRSAAELLMPSLAPSVLSLTYKGRTYSPLVVESIGMPLSSPVNSQGHFVQMSVQMTLTTLTAVDRKDWTNYQVLAL